MEGTKKSGLSRFYRDVFFVVFPAGFLSRFLISKHDLGVRGNFFCPAAASYRCNVSRPVTIDPFTEWRR